MTKLEQVRAKVIEAVPEIMELKFGCHVLYESHNQKHEAIINGINQATTDSKSLMRKYGCHSTIDSFSVDTFTTTHNYPYVTDALTYTEYKEMMEHRVPIKQILGRPIRLADVLIAIAVAEARDKMHWFEINAHGEMEWKESRFSSRWNEPQDRRVAKCSWNLHKDSLDDQSEETINFLHDILCNQ